VTEQRESEKALADAQIKIGQFRLAALRSVMNPHFIFNALNSIQFFITKNDRLNAINYLSTFSKLIRGIISNAVHNTIKLSEEIELLKHYVNLEMLRFENKFTFNLIVDQDLDIDTIEIPSLLIQPYVENAILHGLYNKLEPGRLVITVKAHENGVVVVIEDNGIGRRAAAELRAKNFPNHKSIAMALTEERLRLINTNNPVSFAVEDLIENGHACGTRIMIFISLDNDGRTK
jgi:LytS/YehU family sensor histidine kinase